MMTQRTATIPKNQIMGVFLYMFFPHTFFCVNFALSSLSFYLKFLSSFPGSTDPVNLCWWRQESFFYFFYFNFNIQHALYKNICKSL